MRVYYGVQLEINPTPQYISSEEIFLLQIPSHKIDRDAAQSRSIRNEKIQHNVIAPS